VMLQLVDPKVLSGDEDSLEKGDTRQTALEDLGDLVDYFGFTTHVHQLILAKQLVRSGSNVNAVSIPHSRTPLHNACFASIVTNLDFIE
jgi:hypothetical protein